MHSFGGLKTIAFEGTTDRSIVLCHGFGANAEDLSSLASLAPELNWYFPQAPLQVGPYNYAWFPLVAEEIARLASAGVRKEFEEIHPPGLKAACDALAELVEALQLKRFVIGGFSQGGMLACDYFLQRSAEGLIVLSGSLIDRERWTSLAASRAGCRFFQAHGTFDPVLPYARAEKLNGILKGAGLEGDLLAFPGAHEIPLNVARAAVEFVRGL